MQIPQETNKWGGRGRGRITSFLKNIIAIYSHKTQVQSNKEQQVLQLVRQMQN